MSDHKIKEYLLNTSEEFRKLHDMHEKYEKELENLNQKSNIIDIDDIDLKKIKKMKLSVKDSMQRMISGFKRAERE